MTPTLDEALRAHRGGDPSAAELLVEYCNDRVYLLANRLLPGFARVARHERPSDVAQEALLSLMQALRSTKPESERHLLLLVAKKVRETLHDVARRHAGQRHGVDNLESQGDVSVDQHAALAAAADMAGPVTLDQWTRFQHAVDTLPENEREVMFLKWFLNAEDHEIAETLGCSKSTVKRVWRVAKDRLNEAMGGERPR